MKTAPVTAADLAGSVIAVPPLCRDRDFAPDAAQNARLVRHLETGGVRTLLYGGNANFYHLAPSEFPQVLDMVEEIAGAETLVVPSVGPMFGTMLDQAGELRRRRFPTAMVLPTLFPATQAGIQTAVRRSAERAGIPVVLYLKDAAYLTAEAAAQLVDDGLVSFIKYAVVRADPSDDPLLRDLLDRVSSDRVVSGIGEQPTIAHLGGFGLVGFTSGCVCVNPRLSMDVLAALKAGDLEAAAAAIATFQPLEDLRNAHGPIPVLHHAVAEAGIAETGPLYPMLSDVPGELVERIRAAASALLGERVGLWGRTAGSHAEAAGSGPGSA